MNNNNQENKNPLGKQSNMNMNNPSSLMNSGHRNQSYQSNGSGTSSGMQQQQSQPIQYIKYAPPPPTELMSTHGAMNYNPNTSGAYNQALMYQHQQGNAAGGGAQLNNPNVKSYGTSSMTMRMNKNLLNANQ